MVERIDDIDDPRVAIYKNVKDKTLLREHGLFMAESREVVRLLLTASPFVTRSVLVTQPAFDALAPFFGDTTVYLAGRAVIDEVIGFHIHRGCLACGERGAPHTLDALSGPGPSLLVGLDDVTNPDNIGGLFRNSVAFGARGVVLGPTCADPLYRKSIRTSMGGALRVPFVRATAWAETLGELKTKGYTLVAVTPDGEVEIGALSVPTRVVVLLGNEGLGLSEETKCLADVRVRIPIAPGVDSINVSAAGAVALHRLYRH